MDGLQAKSIPHALDGEDLCDDSAEPDIKETNTEMEGVDESIAREAFDLAAAKLPIKTTFVKRSVM